MNWQFELYTLSETLEEYLERQRRLQGCMCFGFVIIGVIIAIIFIKNKNKPPQPPPPPPPLKSQHKINRYISAFRDNKGTNEANAAAEGLIDEYLYYYSRNSSAEDKKECDAIMKALDDYPFCYSGSRPYPRGKLCSDIIRMLRDKH